MKRKSILLPLSLFLIILGSCGPGPHMHMYGGMDSHDGPYYGAGWDYDSHHHHKKHKKHHKKHKKHKKYKKHHKHHKHHDDD
ncbi:MAG: hypothetical protein K2L80_08895 [Muribaculaceae bacterium]|nr:hypothetical protein [Muribaculaceae bacterium]MDE6332706.1 hypothetical protein [Muribaculaceae bacterium]